MLAVGHSGITESLLEGISKGGGPITQDAAICAPRAVRFGQTEREHVSIENLPKFM